MQKNINFARWAGVTLIVALLAWMAGHLGANAVSARHQAQTQGTATAHAAAALQQAEQEISQAYIALYKLSASPILARAIGNFEHSGDYRAQFAMRKELDKLETELPWPGTLSIADKQKLVITATENTRIGKQLRDTRWQQSVNALPGAELAYLNRNLYLRVPLQSRGALAGHIEYVFDASALGSTLAAQQVPHSMPLVSRARLDLDGEEGLIRLARSTSGTPQDVGLTWSTAQAYSAALPLRATFELPNQSAFAAANRIRTAGELLATFGVLAGILLILLHALGPYLHGIQLLRSMRPSASHEREGATDDLSIASEASASRPHSEQMAYDILATHHVLEEVLGEHTQELEKLYRVLNDEHRRRDQAEGALKEAQTRFHEAVESCLEGVWEWTPEEGLQTWLAESFFTLMGLRKEEFPGQLGDFLAGMAEGDAQTCAVTLQQQVRFGKRFEVEYRLRTRKGNWRWFATRGQVQRDTNGRVTRITGNVQDIHARKHAESEVERLLVEMENRARRDGLTSLYNRETFLELAQSELDRSRRSHQAACLLMFDLDHFKRVNDRYGHPSGDHALQTFSAVLREQTRSSDICARVGGEEFMLLLPETTPAQATELAERIRANISEREIESANLGSFRITCSTGVACGNEADSLENLMQRADQMLYEAKDMGRNRVCSEHDIQTMNPI